jgi:hypothetical protein
MTCGSPYDSHYDSAILYSQRTHNNRTLSYTQPFLIRAHLPASAHIQRNCQVRKMNLEGLEAKYNLQTPVPMKILLTLDILPHLR